MSTITIKQKTAVVEVEGGSRIEVRRMRWKAMRDFLRALAGVVKTAWAAPAEGQSPVSTVLGRLPEIVAGSDELATLICTQSTDLKKEELDELPALVVGEVLRASLEINCDEETKNCLAGISKSLAALMPAQGKATTP